MKFENVGKWMKETEEDKLVFDNREPADYLNGDDEICTLKTEDDESDYDDDFSGELLDEVESDENELESPDNEEDAIIMADESSQKNEGFDTYAVAWKEFDRQDRVIGKQKEFKTAVARDSFIKKLQEHPRFYEIVAMSDPENESSQKNESKIDSSKRTAINDWVNSHTSQLDSDAKTLEKLLKYPGLKNTQALKDYYTKQIKLDDIDGDDMYLTNAIVLGLGYDKDSHFNESSQKNEALDKEKAMELIGAWKSSLMGDNGDFEMHLAKACQHADKNNLMKLEKAFPQLLQKFCAWKSSGKTDRVAQL